ncbi:MULTISPECIES: glycosyltransferase family 2 protein [Xanthomonas]|uniref:Glycosyltransferase family 2 protein n=1 Tax=Xanthomonas dyei TaxID=743699 RepID=A0ABZ0DA09_9XANT|nr:glycosyltransferase family 2 protein [Xanthomonas dyei]WOB25427.1 glycosyltransferase family 2 protein [Xanthomonas dyei]WOB53053.1 glycosyltransferase family 2 protein [Xanthomonas dyei]
MNSKIAANSICAIIVTFNPKCNLYSLIETLSTQFPMIFIVDNGSGSFPEIEASASLKVRHNRRNLGIATALNQGIEDALESGCSWGVTFDQDCEPSSNFLDEMLRSRDKISAREFLLGANYYHTHRNRVAHPPPYCGVDPFPKTTLITSGMLLRLEFAKVIGGFRDDYFIDSVDHEFCLRASLHGAKIMITRTPLMKHKIGMPRAGNRLTLAFSLSHEPIRKYYIARNTIWTIRRYILKNPAWCVRQTARLIAELAGVLFFEKNRKEKISSFARGLKDGIRRWKNT